MMAKMLCLGAVFGGFGGLFGVGGGIIAIPTLVLAFHMDQQIAQGTTLVMILPTVLIPASLLKMRTPSSPIFIRLFQKCREPVRMPRLLIMSVSFK